MTYLRVNCLSSLLTIVCCSGTNAPSLVYRLLKEFYHADDLEPNL